MKSKQKNSKRGFTLLELLIVVIIIGILAGIALPQYQLAVDKATFAKLQSATKSIIDAYKRYNLTNDTYPSNMSVLDIDLPGDYTEKNFGTQRNCRIYQDFYCCITAPAPSDTYGGVLCGKTDSSIIYANRIFGDNYAPLDMRFCIGKYQNNRAQKLCSHFGECHRGCDNGQVIALTPTGNYSGYASYRIRK